jgi:hypothetical protein
MLFPLPSGEGGAKRRVRDLQAPAISIETALPLGVRFGPLVPFPLQFELVGGAYVDKA